VSTILACVGPLLTLLVYQWKVIGDQRRSHEKEMSEINKTLDTVGTLIYDRDVMKKLIVHLAMDDPGATAEAIRELNKRTAKLEDIMVLLRSKKHLQQLIDGKINTLVKDHT
jgi:hypothetical protein